MIVPFMLILASVVLGVAGELLLKSGIDRAGDLSLSGFQAITRTVGNVISNPYIIIGFVCYGTAAIMWLAVLSMFDLSYAYPMLALTYVLVPFSAKFILNETVPTGRWIGIIIVMIGVVVVAWYGRGK